MTTTATIIMMMVAVVMVMMVVVMMMSAVVMNCSGFEIARDNNRGKGIGAGLGHLAVI